MSNIFLHYPWKYVPDPWKYVPDGGAGPTKLALSDVNLVLEPYEAQVARWPAQGRHILAQFDRPADVES